MTEPARARLDALAGVAQLDASLEAVARRLLDLGAVPRESAADAAHIAIAVTNGVEYLVTWNFRHIANAALRVRIERACREAGYEPPALAARSNYDVEAIFRRIREMQDESGREYVTYPARRITEGTDESLAV